MELVTAQSVALVAVEMAYLARGGIQMETGGKPSVLPLVLLYCKPTQKRKDCTALSLKKSC